MVKCLTCQSTRILSIFKKIQNSFIITFKKFLSLFLSLSFLLLSFAFSLFIFFSTFLFSLFFSRTDHNPLLLNGEVFFGSSFLKTTTHLLLLFCHIYLLHPFFYRSKRINICCFEFSSTNNSFSAYIG